MAIKLSKGLKEVVRNNRLESDRHLAMADLMLVGWDEVDAYVVAFSPEMTLSMTYAKNRAKAIATTNEFKDYMNKRSILMGGKNADKDFFMTDSGEKKEFKVLNKQDVLSQLQYMYHITNVDDIKTRTDILKQISDLQGYKDAAVEGDNSTRHYYMPRKCSACEWYEGRKKDKIE